jgi:hypothetical protein
VQGEQGEGQGVMAGPSYTKSETGLEASMAHAPRRCLWLVSGSRHDVSALPTLRLLRVKCNTGPTRLLLPSP